MFCELAHRSGSGLEVTLLWHSGTNELLARVCDRRLGSCFQLRPERHLALDVYYHPYSYARSIADCRHHELLSIETPDVIDPELAGRMSLGDRQPEVGAPQSGRNAASVETVTPAHAAKSWLPLTTQSREPYAGFDLSTDFWSDDTTTTVLFSFALLIAIVAYIVWLGLYLFAA